MININNQANTTNKTTETKKKNQDEEIHGSLIITDKYALDKNISAID